MPAYPKTTSRTRGSTVESEAAARAMRRDPTPAERVLWQALRGRQLAGLKFHRQFALGPYILDFCCSERRLVIEVDGGVHAEQVEYDEGRTEHLRVYGYRVIRFRNEEVLGDLRSVLDQILRAAGEALTPGPSPENCRERGA